MDLFRLRFRGWPPERAQHLKPDETCPVAGYGPVHVDQEIDVYEDMRNYLLLANTKHWTAWDDLGPVGDEQPASDSDSDAGADDAPADTPPADAADTQE